MTLPPDAARPVPDGSELRLGERLHAASLTSPSGRFTLVNTTGGTALYDDAAGRQLWAASTENVYGQAVLALGLDGDLTVWNHHRQPGWRSLTAGLGTERLRVTDAGDVVLLDGDDRVLWTTGTAPAFDPFPPFDADVARGSVLRRGQVLRHQALVSADGGTALMRNHVGLTIYEHGRGYGWQVPMDAECVVSLDPDGILRVRSGEQVVDEIAGPGEQLVVVPGGAELRDGSGTVVWSTAPASAPVSARTSAAATGPSQSELQVCFDSLTTGQGYTAAVVRDVPPAEALRRWGLDEASTVRGTWQQLQSRRADGEVAVAAVRLGPHTLLMAGAPWMPGGDELSAGTTVVRHSYDVTCGGEPEWSMHRDGVTISHIRDAQPRRRLGAELPEIVQAVQEMNEHQSWSSPEWFADFQSLELMCRVAGVSPTAADLRGELLGGVLPAAVAQPPVIVRPERPDRPPLVIEDDLVVVRTDFSDDDAWAVILDEVRRGEFAEEPVAPTDDPGWAGADFEEVLAALPDDFDGEVVYLVDAVSMSREDHAVLAANTEIPAASADYEPEEGVTRTMRMEPSFVTTMHANLQIANLSWEEYCEQLDDPENDVLPGW